MNDGNEGTPATAAAETTATETTTAETASAPAPQEGSAQATADAANAAEQAQEAPAQETAEDTGGAEAPSAPWFKYGDVEFADQAALTTHLDKEREIARRERLNFDDYSQRVATAAQERQAHREAQAKFQQEQQQWAASRAQYEALDAAVRANPQLRQYVAQLLQQRGIQQPPQQQTAATTPGGISMDQLPPEVQQIIQENQAYKEEREWENMLTSVFSDKEALPHGTDEDGVRETLEAISKSPDKAREIALLAARYHHLKQASGGGTLTNGTNGQNGAAPRQLNGAGGAGAPIDSFEMRENETPEELRDRILLAKGLAV